MNGATYMHEIYTRADPQFTGRATVPVLWDKERGTIVNNESADILRMLEHGLRRSAPTGLDLYPADLRAEIDALNDRDLSHAQQRRLPRRLRHHAGGL